MSLAIKYESLEDARLRLKNTVVLYDGEPVFIRNIEPSRSEKDGIFRIHADALPLNGPGQIHNEDEDWDEGVAVDVGDWIDAAKKADLRKFISSKNFDIAPFKMGYVNLKKGAVFCSRVPRRQQKQGLSLESYSAVGLDWGAFVQSKEAVDMIKGRYPTLDQAKALLNKSPLVAFSREFAIAKDEILEDMFILYYKGSKVGVFLDGKVTLGKKYTCLKETLLEIKVNV